MIELTVNGQRHRVDVDPATPLLYVLRNDLRLTGTRFGCGLGMCGACTVLLDGRPVTSCDMPVAVAGGRRITTVEGLCRADGSPGPLQQAFIDEQAAQCGYCISGILVRAAALLERTPAPSDPEIRTALDPSLCRCGSHQRIVAAVKRAAASAPSPAPTPADRR